MMVSLFADTIVAVALVLTCSFAATAFLGMDEVAAWLAGGLAIAGAVRLAVILLEVLSPDY